MSLQAVIARVRASQNITSHAYDEELGDVARAAIQDMIDSGVPERVANNHAHPLVLQAIKCYEKAEAAWEDPTIADGQREAYERIVAKLALVNGHEAGGRG